MLTNVSLAGSGCGHGGPVGCRLRSLARRFAGAFFDFELFIRGPVNQPRWLLGLLGDAVGGHVGDKGEAHFAF